MHVRHAIRTADVTMAPGFPVRVVAASPTEASTHAAIAHTDMVIAGPVPPGAEPVSPGRRRICRVATLHTHNTSSAGYKNGFIYVPL